jgi:hypothetical protein
VNSVTTLMTSHNTEGANQLIEQRESERDRAVENYQQSQVCVGLSRGVGVRMCMRLCESEEGREGGGSRSNLRHNYTNVLHQTANYPHTHTPTHMYMHGVSLAALIDPQVQC